MASFEDYKKHMGVLKVEQKIARMRRELETVNYGDDCPIGGEYDCASVRMAFDRGYIDGLYDALSMLGFVKADRRERRINNDTIYREDAIKAINLRARIPHDVVSAQYASMAINAICSVPSADRPQGKWELVPCTDLSEYFEGVKYGCRFRCSNCKDDRKQNKHDMNFCPNCGAYMKGSASLEYHIDTMHFGKMKGESLTTNKIEIKPQAEKE